MNDEIRQRLRTVVFAIGAALSTGVIGYRWIEGWNYFDSLYMTVITLGTVGYGETHPLSHNGRVFTIFMILFGIGVLTYALSTLTAFIVEGELNDILRRRRMEAKIKKLSGHYIICGAGRTGRTIMEELIKTDRTVVVVDRDGAVIDELQEKGILALQGDPTSDETLIKAGVESARGLFGALPDDPGNVFVTISAKGLNPGLRVVCRQDESGAANKLKRSGADVAIDPGFIGGLRMASEMIRPAAVGFMDSMIRAHGKVTRIEDVLIPKGSPVDGQTIGVIKGSEGNSALVIAIKGVDEGAYEVNPPPARTIQVGDVLVVLGSKDELKGLKERVGA